MKNQKVKNAVFAAIAKSKKGVLKYILSFVFGTADGRKAMIFTFKAQ